MHRCSRWITLVPLASALLFLGGCKDYTDHYHKGMELLGKKDYARANIEFRRAMARSQGTAETYYEAGITAKELKLYQDATKYLVSAENLASPKDKISQDIKFNLGQIALLERDFKTARDRAKWVLERNPGNQAARELLVLALTGLAQPEMAAEQLDLWLAADPHNQQARMIKSGILLSKEDLPEAVRQLEEAAAQPTRTPQTLIALGNLYQLSEQYPKAEQSYRQAVALDPSNAEPLKGLAWLYARTGKRDKAEETFRQIERLKPKDPESRAAMASYYLSQHDWRKAIDELRRAVDADKQDQFNTQRLAAAYLLSGDLASAEQIVKPLLKTDPTNSQTCLLAGIAAFQAGRIEEAIGRLHASMVNKESAVALFFLGAAEDRKGNDRSAQMSMTRALHMDPTMLGARLWLAEYWLRQSSPSSAISLLEKDPFAKRPNAVSQLLKARAYAALGDYSHASRELTAVREQSPLLVPGYYESSLKFLMKQQWSLARVPLEEGLKKEPSSVNLLAVLAQTFIADGKPGQAVARVQEQVGKFPTSAMHFQLLAETQRAAHDYASAKVSYERAGALSPDSPGPLLGLTQTLLAAGKNEEAKARLTELTKRWPQWSQSWTLYGAFMEMQSDLQEATTAYERAVALDSTNAVALNNLAWRLYADAGDPGKALQMSLKARELQPDNPAFADTLGMIYLRAGSRTEAERELAFAVRHAPGIPVFAQHLAAIQGHKNVR